MPNPRLPTLDQVREFVIAGHGDFHKVEAMLADYPALLNIAYEWKPNDTETALQAAAHRGNAEIAEFLLAHGAPLDICTAAMLGHAHVVKQFLHKDTDLVHAMGAHGIPLLSHAVLSGNLQLVQWLAEQGAQAGISIALHNAVSRGYEEIVRWCLETGQADLSQQNIQGQTPLAVARERHFENIVRLLEAYGTVE